MSAGARGPPHPRILTREHLLELKGLRFNHSVTEHFVQGSVLGVLGDLVGLGQDPRIFISHECTGGADPLGQEPHFGNRCFRVLLKCHPS